MVSFSEIYNQGTESFEMMAGSDVSVVLDQGIFPDSPPTKPGRGKNPRHQKAVDLAKQLRELDCGKETWAAYEKLIVEILRLLFKEDLTLWEKQQRTDDALSRFDLICRVNGFDDFWKSLIRSFNTRFILFEFKNYCAEVSQHQVYLTERYLYRSALRSVAIVISRKGPNASAVQAAKGALRENGKLIFFLSDVDLLKMLEGIPKNQSSNDYLADVLDDWLVGLSR